MAGLPYQVEAVHLEGRQAHCRLEEEVLEEEVLHLGDLRLVIPSAFQEEAFEEGRQGGLKEEHREERERDQEGRRGCLWAFWAVQRAGVL